MNSSTITVIYSEDIEKIILIGDTDVIRDQLSDLGGMFEILYYNEEECPAWIFSWKRWSTIWKLLEPLNIQIKGVCQATYCNNIANDNVKAPDECFCPDHMGGFNFDGLCPGKAKSSLT